MPVSGLVIRCAPGRSHEFARSIPLSGPVAIDRVLCNDTLIAVVEAVTVDEEVAIVKRIMDTDGVLDVMVAYHNFEDLVRGE